MNPKRPEALRLRSEGMQPAAIASRLGVPLSTVSGWLDPQTLEKQRARRARYRGTCVECGAPTDGSSGYGKAPKYCAACAPAHYRIWTDDAIISAMRLFHARYGRQPGVTDWNPPHAISHGHPEMAERFHRDGDYPNVTTVVGHFGSWNAAIKAAGFTPLGPGRTPSGAPHTEPPAPR